MRKLVMAIIMASCLFSVSYANLDSGLVVYYPLNGNADDFSPNGHHGTANNIVYDTGRFGQCAVFNGSNSTVNTNSTLNLGTGDFTISLWFNRTNLNNDGGFITNRINDINGFDIDVVPWDLQKVECFAMECSGKSCFLPYAATNYVLGVWHHVVFIRNGNIYKYFVDDTLRGSLTLNVGLVNITNQYNVELGLLRVANPRGGYYDGKLDDVRVYNRALTVSEIDQLYGPVAVLIANKYINIASLADMNNNGYPEIVGLAVNKITLNPFTKIFDGNTNDSLKQINFFNPDWTPKKVTVFDINNDGLQEISVLASKGDSTKIESRKISDGSLVKTIILP